MLERAHTIEIAALNVRSLALHSRDLSHDFVPKETPVLCLSETWFDTFQEVKGYTCIVREKRTNTRAVGVAIYAKDETRVQPYVLQSQVLQPENNCGDVCGVKTKG